MILVIYHVTEIIRHRASTIALAEISRSALCCHRNETRAPIANPPNSAQLEGTRYHSPSYIRVRAVVWECGEVQRVIQTRADAHDQYTFRIVYDSREMQREHRQD